MRQMKIVLDVTRLGELEEGNPVTGISDDGQQGQWAYSIKRGLNSLEVVVSEMAKWIVRLEGFVIGEVSGNDPAESVRALLQASDITSLPEAVAVFATSESEGNYAVFTLNGKAYCSTKKQFGEDVEKSSAWVGARQAKRTEIESLQNDLLKLGFKR